MNQRIQGFDLARAYAIFGMFIVNFNFCFGTLGEPSFWGKFSLLFVGNSTSIFIICAGMGVVFLTNSKGNSLEEKANIRKTLLKRSWFLFFIGVLLYNWWPGDILHFYGGYMHLAAFLIFVPKRYYLWSAFAAISIYFILQFFIPITTSWDLATTQYVDFWTIKGFLRNTLYNGWNSIFPWFAYFAIGMYLGNLNWQDSKLHKRLFIIGLCLLIAFKALRIFIQYDLENPLNNEFYLQNWFHLMTDYFPVNIPYMAITTGWAFMVISLCMYLGNRFSNSKLVHYLVKTGQLTLTLYIFHITVGMLIFGLVFNRGYTGFVPSENQISPFPIFLYSIVFFILSVILSNLWLKWFKKGPIEMLMRKISG
jgi:uncharacterized protein